MGSREPAAAGDILSNAVHKTALWEVHLDLDTAQITASYPPPKKPF